jgi:ribosomal protein L21E
MCKIGQAWKNFRSRFGKQREEKRRKAKELRQILESAYLNGDSVELKIPGEGVTITIEPSAMPEILNWCTEWL